MNDSLFSNLYVTLDDLLHKLPGLFLREKPALFNEFVKITPFIVLDDEVNFVLASNCPFNLNYIFAPLQQIQGLDLSIGHG